MLIDNAVEAAVPADHVNWARDFYADKLGLTPVSEFAGVQLSERTGGAQPCKLVPAAASAAHQ
jgi:hypothetical protein